MPIPQGIPNCPPGLEYLTAVDQLLVHQQVELLEAFTGFETANKYTVKNTLGQKVYWAVEDTTCCTRMCCGPDRPFDIKIMDNFQNEVLHLRRDLRCKSCCFPCCLQKLEVSAPPGNVIGTVVQKWSLCRPVFDIRDRNNETVLTIRGPVCQCPCSDIKFAVFTKDGTEVGKVTKQWTGFVQEHFTDADNFGINFPMDLDVRVKATMLGALFLIDYMYFESSDNKKVRR
ncbi:phospholipid scramblase 1-like isoform X2 [Anopheles arabiensis]|uniref:Phospholipid scramblase n=3 Tax=gambiae species complex TaxID=44542 RepID=Q7PIS6_ANOGA|nr:phospholipid scramblase 1-like isoform X2 [Anopheles arabiensis]XP_040229890.1 phospholipid scramblase 1-like isoform X2 [Anopheles coluzzii]XP_041772582.1 phospholipid scramblase 1-like isoform X2 [Anopheles merus]XP_061501792.1 phospholipid scramblase 1 isoform X2 [Anopheles gambiae]XP_315501.4 phospholipid scramblase 1 isoform X2 [Anopheles gambiae]EAA44032.4 AGAP005498-PB [Anopheles gambiae str. PEST]